MTKRRVIVWGTGPQGSHGLRMVIDHPDLELVGVYAWSKQKVGLDAGELVGAGPTGVQVTDDVDKLLSLEADCLAYFATAANRQAEITADVVPFLERGTNVVSISHFDVQYPAHGRPEYVDPVREACERGDSSIFLTGEEPGFGFGQHLFSLLNLTGHIDRIDLIELSDGLRSYPGAPSLDMYGFQQPLDYLPPMFTSEVGASWHISTLRGIADYMGITVDEVRQTWDTAAFDRDYETAAYGLAKADLTAAIWWKVEALVGGTPVLVYNKILRLHEDAAPDWPSSSLSGDGEGITQRIEISGNPNLVNELYRPIHRSLTSSPKDPSSDDLGTTAVSAVRAIPWLCEAPAGIRVQHEAPAFPPRNVRIG
ncbi:4-hydroxy-tetrahydrodipicolinate reductase [Nocardia kruczakiae]|uniref:4-hydroxy-tetrahydrodipicolinate reductase n=1 Tax=Nocardia kruczakiae TaxID=261477 RepID=A0ABU1XA66_9NOCA|nr:hypothetical protein [Nocardia kruczakiae]MDR7167349.1 4-hydroxy-tetrahydrodipicolinate reductase [Nocardia kruczakiae]